MILFFIFDLFGMLDLYGLDTSLFLQKLSMTINLFGKSLDSRNDEFLLFYPLTLRFLCSSSISSNFKKIYRGCS